MSVDETLQKVDELHKQINALHRAVDNMLDPLCRELMAAENLETIQYVINRLPTCFHKSELRVFLTEKKNEQHERELAQWRANNPDPEDEGSEGPGT